jgi:hypothetical protein
MAKSDLFLVVLLSDRLLGEARDARERRNTGGGQAAQGLQPRQSRRYQGLDEGIEVGSVHR